MKKEVVYLEKARITMLCIFAVLLMVGSSCRKLDDGGPWEKHDNISMFELKPEGISGETMNGDLLINAPAGAVSEPKTLYIKQGPMENHNGFLLKSVEVAPVDLTYIVPIQLSFKYNGSLSNGETVGSGTLELYCFPNERAFDEWELDNVEPMCKGTLNSYEETIEVFISHNGIFAILEQ